MMKYIQNSTQMCGNVDSPTMVGVQTTMVGAQSHSQIESTCAINQGL